MQAGLTAGVDTAGTVGMRYLAAQAGLNQPELSLDNNKVTSCPVLPTDTSRGNKHAASRAAQRKMHAGLKTGFTAGIHAGINIPVRRTQTD